MSNHPYTPPKFNLSAFNCPICNAYANQIWGEGTISNSNNLVSVPDVIFSQCSHCTEFSIWHKYRLIYPDSSRAPLPNDDLPEDIKNDFQEARKILNRSPRGAAAILRLCVQKLCLYLGEPGKSINSDIASLVKKGLNPKIQRSLDVVRVIGNEAVHPGVIDLRDNMDIAIQLCVLINIITDAMITQPKLIDSLYSNLPEEKRQQIEIRDKAKLI